MEQKLIAFIGGLLLVESLSLAASFNLPDALNYEKYDEGAYERMFPDDDILLSRRRQDPETDEESLNEDDTKNTAMSSVSFTSNMDDIKNVAILNGIDITKLPPNYHNTTTIKRKVGGKTITVNVTIDKKTDPSTGETSIHVLETSNTNGVGLNQCTSSKSCGAGKYCRSLVYGDFCSKCRNAEEACYSNEECCGTGTEAALCVSGTCQTGFKQGQSGTICKAESDCNSGMCCTRRFMERNGECKPLAKKGQRCSASNAEISTIMHPGLCPCENGLKCSTGGFLEGFFGGSMDGIFGGNTCRIPSTKRRVSKSPFRLFDDVTNDDEFDDFLER